MTTPLQLANMALRDVGGGRISAIDTSTPAGQLIVDVYDNALRAVVRAHPWNATSRKIELAFVDDLSPEWRDEDDASDEGYAYVLPDGTGKHRYVERVFRLNERDIEHKVEQRTLLLPDAVEADVGDNLLDSAFDLSASDWTSSNVSVTADNAAAPDNTKTADLLTDSSGAAFGYVSQSGTLADEDGVYVADVWVKAGTAARATLEMVLTGGTAQTATLEIVFATPTLNVQSNVARKLHSWGLDASKAGDGWYHLFLAVRNQDNTACEVRLYPSGKLNGNVTDVTTANFWNAKLRLVGPVRALVALRPPVHSTGYLDPGGFDALMEQAASALLSSKCAATFGNLYGTSHDWFRRYQEMLPAAQSVDGLEGTPEIPEVSDFDSARY